MIKLGYKLMSEEHGPTDLVRNARRAEQAGFDFAAISDHFFPWLEEQGHSPGRSLERWQTQPNASD
jgi:alkanesulfonate monooxygenase SsuD/methylene tetrahydromethanopterin reductase-like flavin-dependent oxidoreductase (luciferase family)